MSQVYFCSSWNQQNQLISYFLSCLHSPLQLRCGKLQWLYFHLCDDYCIAVLQGSELAVQCVTLSCGRYVIDTSVTQLRCSRLWTHPYYVFETWKYNYSRWLPLIIIACTADSEWFQLDVKEDTCPHNLFTRAGHIALKGTLNSSMCVIMSVINSNHERTHSHTYNLLPLQ